MKLFWSILSLALVLHAVEVAAAETSTPDQVYAWLVAQQGSGNLLGNQEDDNYSGLYPNAMAAICFMHKGEVERAERIFRVYQSYYGQICAGEPGGFYQFWDAGRDVPHPNSDRWIGDNAWLLIALNHYRARTGKTEFDEMREGIARWLIGLQDKDGGVWSGFNAQGPMKSKATEGNLDVYAALIDHPKEQKRIKAFLEKEMWIEKENRFKMGSTSFDPALDCSSWAVAAFGPKYRRALRYAEKTFLQKQTAKASGKVVEGFSDLWGRRRIWLEGTGEMVVAYNAAGEKEKAQRYLLELEKAMIPSAKFENTLGLPCHTNDPPWPGGDEKIFVPSQAWYLFGAWDLNPMAAPAGSKAK